MNWELELTVYIVSLALCAMGFLFWVLYSTIRNFLFARHTVRFYYPTVRQVALDEDIYLVNEFHHRTGLIEDFHIDHILIGEKYIYCIHDIYYNGTLLSNPNQERWAFYRGKRRSISVPNPLRNNLLRVERLGLLTPIGRGILIPIVLINDDCYYIPFEQTDETGFFLSLKQLGKFVHLRESETIDSIEPMAAEKLAQDLHRINLHE
ncbi:MAG: NERD domain-containing protein [Candidatus Enteromonas sp.]|nr:NERD domain-containing protein [Candidatus Enteromonas sp.]